ncbi:NADPH:quinone oxidoreductase family protein [Alteribacillus sp. YIM 98480]|uniref:NADPH:quinone oxidoreductase family protein n=1 Tax=Alteribacillus sp. YIM 98480 TaxID=2606599 RepID=UPI00131DD5EF|nr:NADPH:quinone oxidoreductase family protein [Alteribacillus sp. YIM 98480]
MKAWQVRKLGEPKEALQIEKMPAPEPGSGEVLIKTEAAALNFFDILLCKGEYQEKPPLPFIPGAEMAGEITDTGPDTISAKGQRVLATPQLPKGGWSEHVVVKEEDVFPIPESLAASEAASMFITYQTSYYALHRCGRLQKGEVLLVHAGSGGVGSAAIQLGKAAGAKIIATSGSDEKVTLCEELGADLAINYKTEDFVEKVKAFTDGRGADVIYDPVGGDVFDRSRKCIAFEGRILVIGFAGGRIAEAPTNHALIKNYSIVGVHFGLFRKKFPEKVIKAHHELMELHQKGYISPMVYEEFSFENVTEALERLGGRQTYGKVVIKP